MMLEQGLDAGWGVRITEVTKRVGLTTGAAYQIWNGSRRVEGAGGQDRFHHDLALYAFDRVVADASNYNANRAWDQADGGASLDRILQRLGEDTARAQNHGTFDAPARFACLVALLASAATDPELAEVGRRAYRAATDQLVEIYRKVFEHFELEMAPPYTLDQLITSVVALIDGLRMRALVDPDVVATGVEAPVGAAPDANGTWYLVATGTRALVDAMTRPAQDG